MDVGIYALQTTRYITGEEPILITASQSNTDPTKFKDVEETIQWQMTFPAASALIATRVIAPSL